MRVGKLTFTTERTRDEFTGVRGRGLGRLDRVQGTAVVTGSTELVARASATADLGGGGGRELGRRRSGGIGEGAGLRENCGGAREEGWAGRDEEGRARRSEGGHYGGG